MVSIVTIFEEAMCFLQVYGGLISQLLFAEEPEKPEMAQCPIVQYGNNPHIITFLYEKSKDKKEIPVVIYDPVL